MDIIDRYASPEVELSNPAQPASYSPSVRDCGKCVASLTAADPTPFDEVLWVLESGANFDMCPSITFGIRIMRNDLGCLISATGPSFPDHTCTTCIDALQEEAKCVTVDGLSVKLLAVGKRCRRDGCRFCWETFAKQRFTLRPK